MAIISQKYNFLFILIPRTGGTSLAELLISRFEGKWLIEDSLQLETNNTVIVGKKHNTIQQLLVHNLITPAQNSDLYKFGTVRNPYDSLVSLYLKQKFKHLALLDDPTSWVFKNGGYIARDIEFCQSHSFHEWIKKNYASKNLIKRYFAPTKHYIFRERVKGLNRVLRFENLEQDFRSMLKELDVNITFNFPLVNVTEAKTLDYREYYGQKTKKIVETAFSEDLKAFNYIF